MTERKGQTYFKGREMISIEAPEEEGKQWTMEQLEEDRKYTEKVKDKYKEELGELYPIAAKYNFSKILVSENAERPRVTLFFPEEIGIPVRDLINHKTIKEFVPEKYFNFAIDEMFRHERSHFIGKDAEEANNQGNRLNRDERQMAKQMEELKARRVKVKGKESLRLGLEEMQLSERYSALSKKINKNEEKIEVLADRQMLKETSNPDVIASMALISPMLSEGVAGARFMLIPFRKLQRKELPYESLNKEMGLFFGKKFPDAPQKTLENLAGSYIKIGGEISGRFDVWEKGNMKKPPSGR